MKRARKKSFRNVHFAAIQSDNICFEISEIRPPNLPDLIGDILTGISGAGFSTIHNNNSIKLLDKYVPSTDNVTSPTTVRPARLTEGTLTIDSKGTFKVTRDGKSLLVPDGIPLELSDGAEIVRGFNPSAGKFGGSVIVLKKGTQKLELKPGTVLDLDLMNFAKKYGISSLDVAAIEVEEQKSLKNFFTFIETPNAQELISKLGFKKAEDFLTFYVDATDIESSNVKVRPDYPEILRTLIKGPQIRKPIVYGEKQVETLLKLVELSLLDQLILKAREDETKLYLDHKHVLNPLTKPLIELENKRNASYWAIRQHFSVIRLPVFMRRHFSLVNVPTVDDSIKLAKKGIGVPKDILRVELFGKQEINNANLYGMKLADLQVQITFKQSNGYVLHNTNLAFLLESLKRYINEANNGKPLKYFSLHGHAGNNFISMDGTSEQAIKATSLIEMLIKEGILEKGSTISFKSCSVAREEATKKQFQELANSTGVTIEAYDDYAMAPGDPIAQQYIFKPH